MITTRFALIASLTFAAPALAEPMFINDPSACGQVMGSDDGMLDYAGNGGLILSADGYSSMEYFCSFTPALKFNWDGYQVSDHSGHCELPGPQYYPQVFTVVMDAAEPGVISIWDGEPEPVQFYRCNG